MVTSRVVRAAVFLAFVTGLAQLSASAEPIKFTLHGQILLADGRPAAGATIEQLGINQIAITALVTADDQGRFSLEDGFEHGVRFQVRSSDGHEQATFNLPAGSVRVEAGKSHEIHLSPAKIHTLHVVRDARPVAEADVVIEGSDYVARGKTDAAGNAAVAVPSHRPPRSMAAYHPQLGVGGLFSREEPLVGQSHEIELLPPAPHEIHVVDDDGKPVAGLVVPVDAAAALKDDLGWITLSSLASTHVRTDEAGIARVTWAPRNLRLLSPSIWSDDWKSDKLDVDKVRDGITTQTLRRKHPVSGRLIVPEGVDPTGILISGTGFGTGQRIDLAVARAATDGSFTLHAPAGHSYLIGVQDNQWAADPWTGDVRTEVPANQIQVELKLYPATPLAVRVTRGPEHQPVADTYVSVRDERRFKFTNDEGKRGNAVGSISDWLITDSNGYARAGVSRGEHKISLSAGEWTEERAIEVTSTDRVEVDFYRPWIGQRKLVGRLVDGGQPFTPSSEAKLVAWTERSPRMPLSHEPRLLAGGTFELLFDAERVSLVFFDPARKRSGAAEIGPTDGEVTIDLKPTATYCGTLVNSENQLVADQEIYLAPKGHWNASIVAQQTDSAGRFNFPSVPSSVSLTARLRADVLNSRQTFISRGDRVFEPGEKREDDQLVVRTNNTPAATKTPEVKLGESVATACRDAKLNHMGVLVLIEGDDSTVLRDLTSRLLDGEETPDVYAYRLVSVSPERQKNEAAEIAQRKWPAALEGQATLLVLGEDQQVAASVTLVAAERDQSLSQARQLLAAQRPPQCDAVQLLAAAREEARQSGRRLWVIDGGPRCGPCFRLARWMDDQRALLEKDYVLVKVLGGVDKNAEAIAPLLPGSQSEGIPFYSITEPDGKVLITSKGPLGNIGMPSDPEGIRHLTKMLESTAQKLTAAEIAELARSLAEKP